MEKSKNLEKICHNRAKKFPFLRGFDCKNTLLEISRNLIRKACFQMTLNARKSWAYSFSKIKTDDNRARFSTYQQNSEKFDNETSKLLSCKFVRETSRCCPKGGWLFTKIRISLPFVTTRPLKYNFRVINGLFHTKKFKMSRRSCSWENNYFVTSIIWIILLQRHGKLLVEINYSFDKDQTTRFIIWLQKPVSENPSFLRCRFCNAIWRKKVAFENLSTVYIDKRTLRSKIWRARTFETSWDFSN